jgi:hypothetical protein
MPERILRQRSSAASNAKRGRVYIKHDDAWGGRAYYAKNGKSCFHPTEQINVVVPTEEVLAWAKKYPGRPMIHTSEADSRIAPPGQRTKERLVSFSSIRQAVIDRTGKKP